MTTVPAPISTATLAHLHEGILGWFERSARDLPWRRNASPWAILVSEMMLQQTPVARVLPVYQAWTERWPTPAALAADAPGDAVRAWGRLGYPRRALRLHASAVAIVEHHGGVVPDDLDSLLALPGVGSYTAAAVSSFAFAGRQVVLDTNVRRVLARVVGGQQFPAASVNAAERELAAALMPKQDAHLWAGATMELGAVICTARAPHCGECPVESLCRWHADGHPEFDGPRRPIQSWDGTDRQCRGRLLAVLRASHDPVAKSQLDLVWPEPAQRERALDGLVADGLVEPVGLEHFSLPR